MDAYEATRIVFSRIQALDPENAAKIMGLLLLQDHGEKEMIRLAFGPETLLHSVILKARKELIFLPPPSPSPSPSNSFGDLLVDDEFQMQEQLYYQDNNSSSNMGCCWSPNTSGSSLGGGFGWKPCLYFQRGFCKNGASCRFLHGDDEDATSTVEQQYYQELLLRSKSQRFGATAYPYSPTGTLPPSPSKCMNFLIHQQQHNFESQRAAAALMSRMERSDFAGMVNPGSRQIYLTFPADSTFREEDVSNYFSIYGPVQDVRIPYQQKRMFGFVTFIYAETVKLILAKGNPHFVCDARVLVKPYKEKGKLPDKYRKQQQGERGDFSVCTTPTGLDSRDPYDFQQLGGRMMYNNTNSSQELLVRKKLEERQLALELQQAIELQGRRFMGLQLMDFKNRSFSSSSFTPSVTIPSNGNSYEESSPEDKSPSPASSGGEQQLNNVVNAVATDKEESATREAGPNADSDFQECVEHNLPDSPFASPTKASSFITSESELIAASPQGIGNRNDLIASTLMPPTSTLDMASFKSCFLQMPRFSAGHGAVGL